MRKRHIKTVLCILAAIFFIPATGRATQAMPDEKAAYDECYKRLEADRVKTDEDAARFGKASRRVRKDVDRLERDRRWCRDHHTDWNHDRFDVGIYVKH